MDHISIASESQENIHVQSKIDNFFDRFRICSHLHRCGIRKRHGHGVRSLTQAIFTLPFVGKNFFRGIVSNKDFPFGKDAAYELLSRIYDHNTGRFLKGISPHVSWERLASGFLGFNNSKNISSAQIIISLSDKR